MDKYLHPLKNMECDNSFLNINDALDKLPKLPYAIERYNA